MDLANEQIENIRNSLPRVRNNPLKYLDRIFTRWHPTEARPNFSFKTVNSGEIFKFKKNLKNSHAHGRDEIDTAKIKLVAPILAPVLAHLVNLSLGTPKFPMKWKMSRIVPLLKSAESDSSNPASFRPVSQLPLISKIVERVAQVQILQYLEATHQLSPNHHAYRIGTSTTSALLHLRDLIATGADNNLITETMTTDLSAAFDSVEHGLLLKKIKYYGLDSHSQDWISSYLSDRSTYVVVGSAESRIRTTTYGVPQGSYLGPLLYLVFINELPSVINEDICGEDCHQTTTELFTKDCNKCGTLPVFADDAQFIISNKKRKENQERIEEVFTKLRNFFEDNGLQINASKTSITEHMTRQKRTKIEGIPTDLTVTDYLKTNKGDWVQVENLITDKDKYRYLGLNFQHNGNWEAHITTGKKPLLQSLRRQLGMITKLENCTSKKIKLQIVNTLLLSRINYMICIWGNSTETFNNKIQVLLNKASRFINNSNRYTKTTLLMENCNWLSVKEMTTYFSTLQMWKTLKLNVPQYLKDGNGETGAQGPGPNLGSLVHPWGRQGTTTFY